MNQYALILTAAILTTAVLATIGAEDGTKINGYGRTKVGALVGDGSYFLTENTLDLRLSYKTGDASFFANPVLYEREGTVANPDLREAYIDFKGDAFDLRVGKQQIIWGKSDGVFITDIVSPKDFSRFLVPDFEELRLAVTGTRIDLYLGPNSLELVWLPWFTPSVTPGTDTIWAPVMPFPITPTFADSSTPAFALENGEYFAKYSFMGETFDISLIGGWFWNDTPAYAVTAKTFTPGVGLTALIVRPEYYRTAAAGIAASGTLGPFVLRAEGAWYGNKRYQGNPMTYSLGYAEKNAIQYLVGADFSVEGFNFGVQFIQDLILEHEAGLIENAVKNTATFVVAKTFLRDTLTAEVFTYVVLDPLNALIKPKLTWDASDALEFFTGAYVFLGTEGDFGRYDANDGVYIGAKLSF